MQKILITGNKGFVGAELTKKIQVKYEIIGYDKKEGKELLDYDQILDAMDGIDKVIHLAAIPHPDRKMSFKDYFSSNCQTTLNLVTAMVEKGVKRLIHVSSTAVYGLEKGLPIEFKSTPIREDQPYLTAYAKSDKVPEDRAHSLRYVQSKIISEEIVKHYSLLGNFNATILRFAAIGKIWQNALTSMPNAIKGLELAIKRSPESSLEIFNIVDNMCSVDNALAKEKMGYMPKSYPAVNLDLK